MGKIELLKTKIDREKYYHSQSTARFLPLSVLLVGMAFLTPEYFEYITSTGFNYFAFIFFVLSLIIVISKTLRSFFITRGNLEEYYNALEKLQEK